MSFKKEITNVERQVNEEAFLISKTDTKGRITYCNAPFLDIVGAKASELIGKPHNVVRHPDMPKIIFKLLWERVKNKNEIFAYVKNRSFDGSYYWVFANVTASLCENGTILGYYSVRRKPTPSALDVIKPLYAKLLEAEKNGGLEASERMLNEILKSQKTTYDEFINRLQRQS